MRGQNHLVTLNKVISYIKKRLFLLMHNGSSFIRAWMEADDPDSESLGRPDSHTVRSSLVHAQQLTGGQMSWQECMMASAEGGQSHEPRTTISLLLYFQLSGEMLYRSRSRLLKHVIYQQINIYTGQIMKRPSSVFSLCVRMSELGSQHPLWEIERKKNTPGTDRFMLRIWCVSYKQSGD